MEYKLYTDWWKLGENYIQPFVCHFMTSGILGGPTENKISVIIHWSFIVNSNSTFTIMIINNHVLWIQNVHVCQERHCVVRKVNIWWVDNHSNNHHYDAICSAVKEHKSFRFFKLFEVVMSRTTFSTQRLYLIPTFLSILILIYFNKLSM
jgi:hypothetical protein